MVETIRGRRLVVWSEPWIWLKMLLNRGSRVLQIDLS